MKVCTWIWTSRGDMVILFHLCVLVSFVVMIGPFMPQMSQVMHF